jgi:pyruvate kinase
MLMRRTKIIATVGPASSSPETLRALLVAGVDVFRLNFSHGSRESHAETFRVIRESVAAAGRQVGVMQDLSGPKIRTGPLAGVEPLSLFEGAELRIAPGDHPGEPGRIFTPFAPLVESARPGDRLLLDDGRIELQVKGRDGPELVTVVVNGGLLGGKKGINAPGVPLPASAVTAKDEQDARLGVELGVDFIALSFVQTPEDVRRAREVTETAGRRVPLIAKIERPAAIENLGLLLEVAQGVMVARGDLGLEMPLERVPSVQKDIIRLARTAGRPVIVATQVLESMRVEPRPTRAEVSDAATAVDQGVDAIMLAGETAVGAFPVRAVETLDRVIREAELTPPAGRLIPAMDRRDTQHGRALCEAAVTLASAGQARAIVAVTRQGKTARLLSTLRPSAPILAATPDTHVARALSIFWGVTPVVTPERDFQRLVRHLLDLGLVAPGSDVVFVNVSADLTRPDANFLNLRHVD